MKDLFVYIIVLILKCRNGIPTFSLSGTRVGYKRSYILISRASCFSTSVRKNSANTPYASTVMVAVIMIYRSTQRKVFPTLRFTLPSPRLTASYSKNFLLMVPFAPSQQLHRTGVPSGRRLAPLTIYNGRVFSGRHINIHEVTRVSCLPCISLHSEDDSR